MKMRKNVFAAVLFIVFAFGTTTAFAHSGEKPNPATVKLRTSEKSNSFRLFYNPIQNERTTLMLKDEDGNVLWKVRLAEAETFAKSVNLRNLPDGKYIIFVTGESDELVQPVTLENKKVGFDINDQTYYEFPEFTVTEDLVTIKMATKDPMNVKLEVMDKKGEKLYTDNVKFNNKLVQKMDMSNLKYGSYTVKVETPYHTFYKNIFIK